MCLLALGIAQDMISHMHQNSFVKGRFFIGLRSNNQNLYFLNVNLFSIVIGHINKPVLNKLLYTSHTNK